MEKIKKEMFWDFPDGPVVKNPPSNARDVGSIPGQGMVIPHASEQLHNYYWARTPQGRSSAAKVKK